RATGAWRAGRWAPRPPRAPLFGHGAASQSWWRPTTASGRPGRQRLSGLEYSVAAAEELHSGRTAVRLWAGPDVARTERRA
ncbi:hypothetical protein ACFRCI_49930, partial [Streptomyces sp. NPDC056638]|uniref:hypothetical protein n=1 Tax=Streptomyces sp. NPDC056638 TaxID=3345887 RepID=UPI0036BD352A